MSSVVQENPGCQEKVQFVSAWDKIVSEFALIKPTSNEITDVVALGKLWSGMVKEGKETKPVLPDKQQLTALGHLIFLKRFSLTYILL